MFSGAEPLYYYNVCVQFVSRTGQGHVAFYISQKNFGATDLITCDEGTFNVKEHVNNTKVYNYVSSSFWAYFFNDELKNDTIILDNCAIVNSILTTRRITLITRSVRQIIMKYYLLHNITITV